MQLFAIVGCAVGFQNPFGFNAGHNPFVEFVKKRGHSITKLRPPVQGASLGGGTAVRIHPIHAVFSHKANQALGKFFHSFVKCFTWGVPMFSQNVVLGFHHTSQTSHKNTTFACEITVNFFFESGWKKIARTNGNPQRQCSFLGATGKILVNCKTRIDAAAVQKVGPNGSAGSLWGYQYDIDVFRRYNVGLVLINNGESM